MRIKRKLKPTKTAKILFGVILAIIIVIASCITIYKVQEYNLIELNYSKEASHEIIFSGNYSKIKEVGENASLNTAFVSSDYIEENYEHYKNVTYVDHENYISNINQLVSKGYTDNDINVIFSHGTNDDVKGFINHDFVENISKILITDYAKLKYVDRYIAYQYENFCNWEDALRYVGLGLDLEKYTSLSETDTYSETMLVNNYHSLTSTYTPENLTTLDEEYSIDGEQQMAGTAAEAFKRLVDDAEKEGYHIKARSAYRSYAEQVEVYDLYLATYGQNYVDRFVAKPGFSEHQTGLCVDVMSTDTSTFADSDEYTWIRNNAYKYGFIERYQKSKEDITGFSSESWHYRYVGVEVATEIYNQKITFDEYYMMHLEG